MTKRYKYQKLASIRHFNLQPEEELSLAQQNAPHTFEVELLTEDDHLVVTDDGLYNFLLG